MIHFRPKSLCAVLSATAIATIAVAFSIGGHNIAQEPDEPELYLKVTHKPQESYSTQYLQDLESFQAEKSYLTYTFLDQNEIATANYPVLEEFNPKTYQVNKSYGIPKEFYYDTLPEEMHCLVEGICDLESSQDISSMFLFAVAASEVGWHPVFVGDNNWFNWTPDAIDYQNFATVEDCIEFTGYRFETAFFNPEWYKVEVDDYFTIDEINSRYAFYPNGSVNTHWGELVGEIIESFHIKYAKWVADRND